VIPKVKHNTVECVSCGFGAPFDFHPHDSPKHLFLCCHRLWCGECLMRDHLHIEAMEAPK